MKYSHFYTFILATTLALIYSCQDEPFLIENNDLGTGMVSPSAIVEFEPSGASLDTRATAGDAMKDIESLSVIMYNEDEELAYLFNTNDLIKLNKNGSTNDLPTDYSGTPAESSTRRATFTLPQVHVGKYYIYAVANMGDLTADKVATPDKLRNIKLEWKKDNIGKNSQMFGFFTPGTSGGSEGYEAPLVSVSPNIENGTQFHAWVKRAASKVTLVYDPQGLHEDIFIYIHKVTIRDIPMTCPLGADNTPADTNLLYRTGESIYYNNNFEMLDKDHAPAVTDYKKWMRIGRGTGKRGAVEKIDGKTVEHSETAKALYFYENLQGDYKDSLNKEHYYKPQIKDSVGTNVYPGMNDYKDNVSCGTYIEVEGYYISQHDPGISSGPIKYRFMLGQDTEYNYNANRNRHYKLTLGFKGYANQPDWHIEYIEESPEIFVSETFYVSYLYNQSASIPVRLVGDCTALECEILENDWWPYDPDSEDGAPDGGPLGESDQQFYWYRSIWENKGNYDKVSGGYDYGRHKKRYDENVKGADTTMYITPPHLGFLSLTAPSNYTSYEKRLPSTILCNPTKETLTYRSDELIKGLKDYYEGNGGYEDVNYISQDKRTFDVSLGSHDTGRNAYTVTELQDGSKLCEFNMWTRPKSMIKISGFSGNNPYEAYQRKAIVRFRGTFKLSNGDKRVVYKDVPVFQVRRIINPKGVWRHHDNNAPFEVKLMHRVGARDTTFKVFESEGEWRAYPYRANTEKEFFTLSGGSSQRGDTIYGETDTPIEFTINFSGKTTATESNCAMIRIEYHGLSCNHTIFVRQGYSEPLEIVSGKGAWSSFSLYAAKHPYKTTTGTATAVLTTSPLALGTLFKRGNLSQGILINNNKIYGNGAAVGNTAYLEVADLDNANNKKNPTKIQWNKIYGANVYDSNKKLYGKTHENWTYNWPDLKAELNGKTFYYRLPTYEEFQALTDDDTSEYGVGVLYGDGASAPAETTHAAFEFEDVYNEIEWNSSHANASKGMRGFIIYNPWNANQVFFPVGAKGIGRRTLQGATSAYYGTLRYASVTYLLSETASKWNVYRPITYNLWNNAGAIYWIDGIHEVANNLAASIMAWDMNFTDLNFNGYDTAVGFYDNGDALPIKLIVTREE